MPDNPFVALLNDIRKDNFTGSLAFPEQQAKIYFLFANPIHAIYGDVVGEEALELLMHNYSSKETFIKEKEKTDTKSLINYSILRLIQLAKNSVIDTPIENQYPNSKKTTIENQEKSYLPESLTLNNEVINEVTSEKEPNKKSQKEETIPNDNENVNTVKEVTSTIENSSIKKDSSFQKNSYDNKQNEKLAESKKNNGSVQKDSSSAEKNQTAFLEQNNSSLNKMEQNETILLKESTSKKEDTTKRHMEKEQELFKEKDILDSPVLDKLPLLPEGEIFVKEIPLSNINLSVIASSLKQGMVRIHNTKETGFLCIEEGKIFFAFHVEKDIVNTGRLALNLTVNMKDALVTVYNLPKDLIAFIPELVVTPIIYDNLKLGWLDWPSFYWELLRRNGKTIIEIQGINDAGVIFLRDGKALAVYTKSHPKLGPLQILKDLLLEKRASIRVRQIDGMEDENIFADIETVKPAEDIKEHQTPELETPDPEDLGKIWRNVAEQNKENFKKEDVKKTEDNTKKPNETSYNSSSMDNDDENNTTTQEMFFKDYRSAVETIADSLLGLSSKRLQNLFDEAENYNWTLEKLASTIEDLNLRGIAPGILINLSESIRELA